MQEKQRMMLVVQEELAAIKDHMRGFDAQVYASSLTKEDVSDMASAIIGYRKALDELNASFLDKHLVW